MEIWDNAATWRRIGWDGMVPLRLICSTFGVFHPARQRMDNSCASNWAFNDCLDSEQ
jgi:hypothetical protein